MAFIHLSGLIIYFVFILYKLESKFIGIESIGSENYFVVLDSGIYLYNKDFTEKNKISNINLSGLQKINIIKHIFNKKIYIFCLINNNLYYYVHPNGNFYNYGSIVDWDMINYVNIIPYNEKVQSGSPNHGGLGRDDNNLKLIKIIIDYNDYYGYFFCYSGYNINNANNLYLSSNEYKEYEVNSYYYKIKSVCHLLNSALIIKCIFYDNEYFLNLEYNLAKKKLMFSPDRYYYPDLGFLDFSSSKSNIDNYLVCPIYSEKIDEIDYNYTECDLCNNEEDFGNCSFINNSYIENCSKVRTYFFNETKKYGVICQRFNEFIFLIISYQNTEVEKSKIIYFDCDNFEGYNGEFSMIYNNSLGDYNIITDYNFTENPKCSIEIKEEMNFSEKTNTHTEI